MTDAIQEQAAMELAWRTEAKAADLKPEDRALIERVGGKCRVPMWMGGMPSGHCGEPANGPRLPFEVLYDQRGWRREDVPYCHGPCCPKHGGPRDGEPIVFQDGWTAAGRQMWCAVMPDFENLQESPAGFDGDGRVAIAKLKAAIAREAQP